MASVMSPSSRLAEHRRGKGLSLNISKVAAAIAPANHCNGVINDSYTLLEPLGSGSFSVVFKAVDKRSKEQVALKLFSETNSAVVTIAEAEFLMLQRIEHPNIVRALEFLTSNDEALLALSFFNGKALGSAVRSLKGQRLPESISCRLFESLISALGHIHSRQIIHCDVKPQNVLVSHDFSDLQLIDFNAAVCVTDEEVEADDIGSPSYTPAYAAPEVSKGGMPSAASDIWGAGLCLCTMLSGQCSDIHLKMPNVSDECRTTMAQCLSKDQDKRPDAATLLMSDWFRSEWPVETMVMPVLRVSVSPCSTEPGTPAIVRLPA